MSNRRPTDPSAHVRTQPRGFTLLECEVAVLVLALFAVGLAQLTTRHDRLVASLESWTQDDPTWFVTRPDEPLERVLGLSAELSAFVPPSEPSPGPPDVVVTVSSVARELHPPTASALVHLEDA